MTPDEWAKRMRVRKNAALVKAWRAKHPEYNRDWQRKRYIPAKDRKPGDRPYRRAS